METHYPSWGSGTTTDAGEGAASHELITPHGDREPFDLDAVLFQLGLITPHGDREPKRSCTSLDGKRWSGLFRQVEGEAKIVSDWFFAPVEAVSSGMSGPPSTPSRQTLESLAWGCRALRAGSGATGAQGTAPRNAGGQPAAIGR